MTVEAGRGILRSEIDEDIIMIKEVDEEILVRRAVSSQNETICLEHSDDVWGWVKVPLYEYREACKYV
jgi:hypothetical protein